jgi:hypothetical protein
MKSTSIEDSRTIIELIDDMLNYGYIMVASSVSSIFDDRRKR